MYISLVVYKRQSETYYFDPEDMAVIYYIILFISKTYIYFIVLVASGPLVIVEFLDIVDIVVLDMLVGFLIH